MGLSIYKSLADLMNGSVTVLESYLGHGSTFEAVVEVGVVLKSEPVVHKRAKTLPGKELKGKRILCAEDNMVNQIVIKKVLAEFGVVFDVSDNGAIVLAKYCDNPGNWDMVLM